MRDVAIIGAGELGGLIAHVLARGNRARQIRLIDEHGNVAAGKALDITQAAPIEGFATVVSGSPDVTTAAGAAIVVVADRVGGGEWEGEAGLMLLNRLGAFVSSAVILCAGATHRDLIERGVRELHIPRSRLFGSAPAAFAGAARALVALEANGSPRDVSLSVLGVPPSHLVIPWEEATFGGFPLTRVLDEPARRRIVARLLRLWPPGPYALASAAALAIDMMSGRTRRVSSCFVAPDDSAGTRVRTAALPVRLDPSGIAEVVLPPLNGHDRVALDNAMLL